MAQCKQKFNYYDKGRCDRGRPGHAWGQQQGHDNREEREQDAIYYKQKIQEKHEDCLWYAAECKKLHGDATYYYQECQKHKKVVDELMADNQRFDLQSKQERTKLVDNFCICPRTRNIYTDPVLAVDGRVYDRHTLQDAPELLPCTTNFDKRAFLTYMGLETHLKPPPPERSTPTGSGGRSCSSYSSG